jgi:biopolymer transport protein ExbD
MRIEATSRARRLSLTSLIDVIFLLLLFFMLSSTFTRFAEVEISGGEAVGGATGQPDILLRLADEGLTVNGLAIDEAALAAELKRLEDLGAESAVLLVRGEATSQDLVTTVETVQRETGLSLSVAR